MSVLTHIMPVYEHIWNRVERPVYARTCGIVWSVHICVWERVWLRIEASVIERVCARVGRELQR